MKSICFLMEFRGHGYVHPVLSKVMADLEQRGWRVAASVTEHDVRSIDDFRIEHDLYVLKSSSPMTDCVASLIARNGGQTLNHAAAVQKIRNKVWTDKFLRDAGIPIPESYLAGAAGLEAVLEEKGPLIIKPIDGRHGVGVRVATTPPELRDAARDACVYAQELKAGDGFDRKIYVAGEHVWASRKAFASGESYMRAAEPFEATPEMRALALRAGQLLGLEIYGLDMIEARDGLWVVDVNGFPGFKGVPDAAPVLAGFIDRRARATS